MDIQYLYRIVLVPRYSKGWSLIGCDLCALRLSSLLESIMMEKENKTIIFVETKRRVDELTRRLRRDG